MLTEELYLLPQSCHNFVKKDFIKRNDRLATYIMTSLPRVILRSVCDLEELGVSDVQQLRREHVEMLRVDPVRQFGE